MGWTSFLKSSKQSKSTQSSTQKAMALLFRTLWSAKMVASALQNADLGCAVSPGRGSCAAATLGGSALTIWWRTGLRAWELFAWFALRCCRNPRSAASAATSRNATRRQQHWAGRKGKPWLLPGPKNVPQKKYVMVRYPRSKTSCLSMLV